MASSNGHTESADTTGTGIPTVETHDGLAKLVVSVDAACSTIERLAAELARVHAQRDALAEALRDCEMLVEQQAERYPGDRDEAARLAKVRSALSTGGGK